MTQVSGVFDKVSWAWRARFGTVFSTAGASMALAGLSLLSQFLIFKVTAETQVLGSLASLASALNLAAFIAVSAGGFVLAPVVAEFARSRDDLGAVRRFVFYAWAPAVGCALILLVAACASWISLPALWLGLAAPWAGLSLFLAQLYAAEGRLKALLGAGLVAHALPSVALCVASLWADLNAASAAYALIQGVLAVGLFKIRLGGRRLGVLRTPGPSLKAYWPAALNTAVVGQLSVLFSREWALERSAGLADAWQAAYVGASLVTTPVLIFIAQHLFPRLSVWHGHTLWRGCVAYQAALCGVVAGLAGLVFMTYPKWLALLFSAATPAEAGILGVLLLAGLARAPAWVCTHALLAHGRVGGLLATDYAFALGFLMGWVLLEAGGGAGWQLAVPMLGGALAAWAAALHRLRRLTQLGAAQGGA